jgi:hypothetical protein
MGVQTTMKYRATEGCRFPKHNRACDWTLAVQAEHTAVSLNRSIPGIAAMCRRAADTQDGLFTLRELYIGPGAEAERRHQPSGGGWNEW